MQKRTLSFGLILLFVLGLTVSCGRKTEVPVEPFYQLEKMEIDSLLKTVSQQNLSVTERINLYSQRFLGTPYELHCAGEGPYGLYDNKPLVNFEKTNCMLYCEHVLALAISDSWENFFNNLQHIRYKDGVIGMKTRNHYTMADWLPENNWLLSDVTARVGGEFTRSVTRTISHRSFFRKKGLADLRHIKPDREMTVSYVPLEKLATVKENTATGDILALIYADKDSIFSAHMLMIAEKDKQKVIREASNSKMTTFETPYDEWVQAKQGAERYAGLAFMRVRGELNKPGMIVLPWEINTYKENIP